MSSTYLDMSPAALKGIARQAYIYTVPLIIMEWTRKKRIGKGANVFNHARKLLNHRSRFVTTPNNDTLYSDAWLDLSRGPINIEVPAHGERYFSLAFMDMYTNNFAILGTRTTGGDGGTYTIVGPDHLPPSGAERVVKAPTNRVWALARVLVDGTDDLPAACAVQDGLYVHDGATDEDVAPGEPPLRLSSWDVYFEAASRLLQRELPPVTDERVLKDYAALGICPAQRFDAAAFDVEQAKAIEEGVEDAKAFLVRIQRARGAVVEGWTYPNARTGDFEQQYLLRAVIAVGGLGALPREEAMYMRAEGDDQESGLFDGNRNYVLHFEAGEMPPLESFWSLTLYEAMDDGQFFFADTPLGRYSIGDRTDGLTWNEDGSLDIWIGAREPEAGQANWLPAPEGLFSVVFRGYIPKSRLLNGAYLLPKVKRAV